MHFGNPKKKKKKLLFWTQSLKVQFSLFDQQVQQRAQTPGPIKTATRVAQNRSGRAKRATSSLSLSLSLSPTLSQSRTTMPAIPSSLLHLKPLFFSLPRFSSPSLALSRARKFPIPIINPRSLSSLSSAAAAAAQSTGDNGSGGGRSGALAPPPITEELQKIDVNPPKGTRDFPPEEMRLRTWLFHNFREV